MAPLVLVHVGTASQHLETRLQRLAEEVLRHAVAEDAFLREGDEPEVEHAGQLGPQAQERLDAAQLDVGIDLDVRAHRRAAVPQGQLQHAPRAPVDVVDGERLLQLGDERLRGGPAGREPPRAVGDEGLVRVDVAFDEARQDELVRDVERLPTGRVERRADAPDAPVAQGHVLPAAVDQSLSQQQIAHGARSISPSAAP